MEFSADATNTRRDFYCFLFTVTRTVTDQDVRVFRMISVTVTGNFRMTISSIHETRLLPQPGEPIFPDNAAWFGVRCFCSCEDMLTFLAGFAREI